MNKWIALSACNKGGEPKKKWEDVALLGVVLAPVKKSNGVSRKIRQRQISEINFGHVGSK